MDVRNAPDALIGQILGGYQIQRRLGQGGMAVVYAAHQSSMQRDVAIKVMRQEIGVGDPVFYSRFEREARTTAALEHVHILPVIDFGQDNGRAYLVMRLLDNNLANVINKETLALDEIVRILSQVADALDYAHEHHVIHRDLKPSNILLDKQRNCYLADFGIAHLANAGSGITMDGAVMGTPGYMSPEQVRGATLTGASDRYALGVTLYEMVCNQLPFTDETPFVLMNHHLITPPPSCGKCRPDLPPACDMVIDKAMAKEPSERYATARAMVAAFAQALAQPASQVISPGSKPAHQPDPDLENAPTIMGESTENPARPAHSAQPSSPTWGRFTETLSQVRRLPRKARLVAAGLVLVTLLVGGWLLVGQRRNAADAAAYNESGATALAKVDYNTAIDDFKEAIRLDPTYAAAYYNLGVAYDEQGNTTDAQQAFETALKYDDHLLFASYRLAEILLDAKDLTNGFRVADNAMRILQIGNLSVDDSTRKQLSFLLYTTRGRAYQMRGTSTDLSLAENDLQQALVFKDAVPYPAPAYYYLALVSDALGKKDAARQSWLDMLGNYDQNSARQREWAVQAEAAIAEPK